MATSAFAGRGRGGKDAQVAVVGGLPNLLGLQMGFIGLKKWTFGAEFGMYPGVDSYINDHYKLNPIPIGVISKNPYYLVPTAEYNLMNMGGFIRFFPFSQVLFLHAGFGALRLGGNISADFRDELTGFTMNDVVSADLTVWVPHTSLLIGLEAQFGFGLFLNVAIGGMYLIQAKHTLDIGGLAGMAIMADPDSDDGLTGAKKDLDKKITKELENFYNQYKISPAAFFSIGFAF